MVPPHTYGLRHRGAPSEPRGLPSVVHVAAFALLCLACFLVVNASRLGRPLSAVHFRAPLRCDLCSLLLRGPGKRRTARTGEWGGITGVSTATMLMKLCVVASRQGCAGIISGRPCTEVLLGGRAPAPVARSTGRRRLGHLGHPLVSIEPDAGGGVQPMPPSGSQPPPPPQRGLQSTPQKRSAAQLAARSARRRATRTARGGGRHARDDKSVQPTAKVGVPPAPQGGVQHAAHGGLQPRRKAARGAACSPRRRAACNPRRTTMQNPVGGERGFQPAAQDGAQPRRCGVQPTAQGGVRPVAQGGVQPTSQGGVQPVAHNDAEPVAHSVPHESRMEARNAGRRAACGARGELPVLGEGKSLPWAPDLFGVFLVMLGSGQPGVDNKWVRVTNPSSDCSQMHVLPCPFWGISRPPRLQQGETPRASPAKAKRNDGAASYAVAQTTAAAQPEELRVCSR